LTTTARALDAVTIDGVSAPGLEVTTVSRGTTKSAACPLIDESDSVTAYVDPKHDTPAFNNPGNVATAVMDAVALGECRLEVSRTPQVTPLPNQGRLALYSLLETRQAYSVHDPPLSATTLTVRGHVRDLGPADAGIFEIPPGFKELAPLR
jgi:hypothetical protein